MKIPLIIGIDFKSTRTKMGLVDARNGKVLEIVIFRAEKNYMDKLLSGIEHGIEILNSKSNTFHGLISGIGVVWPEDMSGRDVGTGFWKMMDKDMFKNILEKRFSLLCRIESEDHIFAIAETFYGVVGENSAIQGCAALFALNQRDKI